MIKLVKGNRGIRGDRKLTRKDINTLQKYYGMAIRSSRQSDIQTMKFAIAAVLCHCVRKVDEESQIDINTAPMQILGVITKTRVKSYRIQGR